jgi:hypothetical protein
MDFLCYEKKDDVVNTKNVGRSNPHEDTKSKAGSAKSRNGSEVPTLLDQTKVLGNVLRGWEVRGFCAQRRRSKARFPSLKSRPGTHTWMCYYLVDTKNKLQAEIKKKNDSTKSLKCVFFLFPNTT